MAPAHGHHLVAGVTNLGYQIATYVTGGTDHHDLHSLSPRSWTWSGTGRRNPGSLMPWPGNLPHTERRSAWRGPRRGPPAQERPQRDLVVGEQAVADGPVGGQAQPVAGAAEGAGDTRHHADLAPPVAETVAVGGRRVAVGRLDGVERPAPLIRARTSSLGTTWSRRQPPSASRGMNSMKRTVPACRRAKAAKSRTSSSLTPAMSTTLTLTGHQPGGLGRVHGGQDGGEVAPAADAGRSGGAARSRSSR